MNTKRREELDKIVAMAQGYIDDENVQLEARNTVLDQLEAYIEKELEEDRKKWGKTIGKLMKRGMIAIVEEDKKKKLTPKP